MFYLIIIFAVLFFFLAWRRLDWAVMLLIAALPAYLIRFSIFGLPATLLEVMIWIVFLVWSLKNYRYIIENLKLKIKHSFKIQNSKFKIIYRYPFDWEIVLMLLIALTAVAAAGFSNSSFGIWKAYFFEPALLFIVVINTMKGDKGREKILSSLAISALTVSLLAIYQKITGQLIDNSFWAMTETRRVVSFFGYPNAVGLYLGPLVLIFIGWLCYTIINNQDTIIKQYSNFKQKGNKFGNWKLEFVWNLFLGIWDLKTFFVSLTIVLSGLSIYFTKSKGALMGVAAGLIVFGLLAGKKIRWAVVIVLVLTGAGLALSQPARHEAFKYLTLNDFSGQVRRAQWRETLAMLKDGRLLTGAGLANYQRVIVNYHAPGIFIKDFDDPLAQRKLVFNPTYRAARWQPLEIYLYPHNIVLNFWSELGLAGLLLFVWIIGKFLIIGIWYLLGNWKSARTNIPARMTFMSGWRSDGLEIGNLARQKNKYIVLGLLGAMIVIIVHGVVDVPYFKNDLAVMFWLLVAMMSFVNLENKLSLPYIAVGVKVNKN